MTELKPCPFCGYDPETHVYCSVWDGNRQVFVAEVKCPSCKIARHALATSGKEAGEYLSFADFDSAFNKAEEAWNRRCDDD